MRQAEVIRAKNRPALPDVPSLASIAALRTPELGGDYTVDEIEREHILRVVARSSTLEEAARTLGIESSTLWRKRKRYGDALRGRTER